MAEKKGSQIQEGHGLSNTQKEILRLLTEEYLTPVKVANIRNTSVRAVYKTIGILAKKGLYSKGSKKVHKIEGSPVCEPFSNYIRLHAQEFNITILNKTNKYEVIRQKANTINIDENTIRLYQDSIEIYSGKSFYSDDVGKATAKSFEYWNKLFRRLENDLGLLLVKNRYQNIKLVKNHYSYINNGMAQEFNENKIKIRLYATEDSKMWFEIDNSLNLDEAETTHTQTASRDMQNIVRKTFNDLRDNFAQKGREVPVMSEIMTAIEQLTKQNIETATGLNAVVQLLKGKEPTEEKEDLIPLDYIY
jgi:hypothetical protein